MTWVSTLLLLILIAAVYLGIVWVPVWFLNLDVKQRVRDFMNQAVKETDDAALVEKMCGRLASLDSQLVPNENGELVEQPVVQVAPAQITWQRSAEATPPTLHVAFSYTRNVRYPLINRWAQVTIDIDLTNDLTRADWGAYR